MSFKIETAIDDEKIKGLLCCAFEGGVGYWATIAEYSYAPGVKEGDFSQGGKYQGKDYWHRSQLIPLVDGCAVVVEDIETQKEHRLDKAAIQKGLKAMQEKCPRHWGDFLSGNDDATTGDVFLQCCLFGEVVYG